MKTFTIRDEAYRRLAMLKSEGESFSDVIEMLLTREKFDLSDFLDVWVIAVSWTR